MKRIITCSDGTWNKPGTKDRGVETKTNVEKMYKCIAPTGSDKDGNTVRQLKAYDQGVGTGYTMKDRLIGGMTGDGIDKNIKDLYVFLCLSYEPGDEIYLFGFSRGAYTARSIGGFIRTCGILRPENIHLVEMAYKLYRDRNAYSNPSSDLMRSFRGNYCHEDITPIKCIAVWDTVGALGIPLPWYKVRNKNKYHFHDVTLGTYVENAFHALAIDDRRKLFTPTIWEKSKEVLQTPNHPQQLEQRWFAGSHSNIGGGYADCGPSNIVLQWIIDKTSALGLNMVKPHYDVNADLDKGELRNSYTTSYWFWLPVWRKMNIGDPVTNQTLDDSVTERYKTQPKYKPTNVKPFIK